MSPEQYTALKTFVARINSDIQDSRENSQRIVNEVRLNIGIYPDYRVMCDVDAGENAYGFEIKYDIEEVSGTWKQFNLELEVRKQDIREGLAKLIMG